jgi:glycosyltransferase involved in cell wall biosynthesis
VHLHWLELLAFDPNRRNAFVLDVARTLRLCLTLILLRWSRVQLVWTVHNLKPHESARPWLYRLLERTTARAADVLLAHSRHAAEAIKRDIAPRGGVHVGYHGSYLGWYPASSAPRTELRASYGFDDDSFVFLLFGQVRPYKRVSEAIRTFRRIDGDRFRLFVVGMPAGDVDRSELESLAAGDPRVVLCLRWIADEEVDGFHSASDVAVLNYREIFSSGALLLAWSLGRPVVAPEGGSTDELAEHGPIERFGPGELAEAFIRASNRWPDGAVPNADAIRAAQGFEWDAMAELLVRLYAGKGPGPGAIR